VSLVVSVEELTRSSSEGSVLPEALSEALGISLSEVCGLYFGDMDGVGRDCIIEGEWDRHQEDCHYEEEREETFKEEHCWELRSYYEDDTEVVNSISVDVVVSENAVSQCKGERNRKRGRHFHNIMPLKKG
jgi:hypothetical protein